MSDEREARNALRAAAQKRREQASEAPLWERRAAGQLGEGEEQKLAGAAEHDDFVAHMKALTAPSEPARIDALQQQVAALLASPAAAQPAQVVSLAEARKRRGLLRVALPAALAAAAALLIVWLPARERLVLPPYEAQLMGVDAVVRAGSAVADPTQRQRISAGAQVSLVARPLESIVPGTALAARLFLVQGREAARVDVSPSVMASGAVQVSAPYDALFGARGGAWDLVLFVGDVKELPADSTAALELLDEPGESMRTARFPLLLSP